MLRILLDAHFSGRVIATALRKAGHDVLALTEEPALEGLDDALVLELAAREQRIPVTHNIRDFAPLLREWGESGRSHPGCVLVHGLDHADFGRLLGGLDRQFGARPTQDEWIDVALFLTRRG